MYKKAFYICIGAAFFLILSLVFPIYQDAMALASETKRGSINEKIAQLKGPNRQKVLEEGARKEGKLLWYTTQIVDEAVRPILGAFQKKYPFIKVDYYRTDTSILVQKAKAEFDSNLHLLDILDGGSTIPPTKEAGMLIPFYSPEFKNIQDHLVDPEGYWVAQNIYYMTLAYNTEMVKAAEVPKNYEDLLNPRWKGKMAWSNSAGMGAPQLIGGLLKHYGEANGMQYLRKLVAQDVAGINGSVRSVLDKIVAGDYPIGLNMLTDHVINSSKNGAPIKGIPMQPANSIATVMGLLKNAPHPHAAMLFIDFFCSDEGQTILRDVHLTPASKNIKPDKNDLLPQYGNFKIQFLDTTYVGKNSKRWQTIYNDMFLK